MDPKSVVVEEAEKMFMDANTLIEKQAKQIESFKEQMAIAEKHIQLQKGFIEFLQQRLKASSEEKVPISLTQVQKPEPKPVAFPSLLDEIKRKKAQGVCECIGCEVPLHREFFTFCPKHTTAPAKIGRRMCSYQAAGGYCNVDLDDDEMHYCKRHDH